MNLVEYQAELEKMIETHRLDQRPQLENLANLSPEHLKIWEDYLMIEDALPAWKQALPEIDLVESVLSQLHASQETPPDVRRSLKPSPGLQTRPRSGVRWVFVSFLSVATILVLISLKFSGSQSSVLPPLDSVAVNTNVNSEHNTISSQPDQKKQSFNQLLHHAGAASWGLAQSTAGAMTDVVTLVPVTPQTPETTDRLSDDSNWVKDINNEMQPLRDQISHAWNFIIHSVPDKSTNI